MPVDRDRDRALARERMRRLRADGLTVHDKARHYATRTIIANHKDEFIRLKHEYEEAHID
jgi:hypothetical protein